MLTRLLDLTVGSDVNLLSGIVGFDMVGSETALLVVTVGSDTALQVVTIGSHCTYCTWLCWLLRLVLTWLCRL